MKKVSVLYVDDEPDVLYTLKMGLEDRGYEVETCESGADALDKLKTLTPDIIIADLRMSPMNGFELFQEVKKNEQFVTMPFFFLTAVDDFLAQKYGHTLGVDAYLTKPVDLDGLDAMIKGKVRAK